MKVLLLSPTPECLLPTLERAGDEVDVTIEKIDPLILRAKPYDFIISYGYRHLINADVISLLKGQVINLHISYLPYNRGADPNFWSWHDMTPKGVTIHYVNAGLDTGDIIYRKRVTFSEGHTLKSSYEALQQEMVRLFDISWTAIRSGKCPRQPQNHALATSHRTKDKSEVWALMPLEYDTPVSIVEGLGK